MIERVFRHILVDRNFFNQKAFSFADILILFFNISQSQISLMTSEVFQQPFPSGLSKLLAAFQVTKFGSEQTGNAFTAEAREMLLSSTEKTRRVSA